MFSHSSPNKSLIDSFFIYLPIPTCCAGNFWEFGFKGPLDWMGKIQF